MDGTKPGDWSPCGGERRVERRYGGEACKNEGAELSSGMGERKALGKLEK